MIHAWVSTFLCLLETVLTLTPQAVETIDAEIAAVQQRLEELRELREARVKEAADAQAALDEARDRLVKLVQVFDGRQNAFNSDAWCCYARVIVFVPQKRASWSQHNCDPSVHSSTSAHAIRRMLDGISKQQQQRKRP